MGSTRASVDLSDDIARRNLSEQAVHHNFASDSRKNVAIERLIALLRRIIRWWEWSRSVAVVDWTVTGSWNGMCAPNKLVELAAWEALLQVETYDPRSGENANAAATMVVENEL